MRHAILAGAVTAATVLGSGVASAEEPPSGIEVGLRTGYAIPFGNASGASGDSLSNEFNGAIPIWIDAGYRFPWPNLFVGAYFQYGVALINTSKAGGAGGSDAGSCSSSGVSCSGNVLMYGLEAQVHLRPYREIDPWVGLGVGLENTNLSASVGGQTLSGGASGWDYVTIMGGVDYKILPELGVGPFVNFTLGQYDNESSSSGGQSQSSSIQNTAMHEWLTLGVRGTYDLKLF